MPKDNTSLCQVPALHKKFVGEDWEGVDTVLDYGCGKHEKAKAFIEGQGKKYIPYDPFHMSYEDSCKNFAMGMREADMTICSNVLNVIVEKDERLCVYSDFVALLSALNCIAISVYEGDRSCIAKQTTKGHQMNQPLKFYYNEIEDFIGHLNVEFEISMEDRYIFIDWIG